MSGPMAASFGIEVAVLASAQSLAEGAAEIAAGLEEAERQAEAQRAQRRAERHQMREAVRAGAAKQQQALAARQTRLDRLLASWQVLGHGDAGIAPPQDNDPAALDRAIAELETRLRQLAAGMEAAARADLTVWLDAGPSVAEQVAAYLAQARLAGQAADALGERKALVAGILERLDLDAGETVPSALDRLVEAAAAAPTRERAAALATELRLQVQRHNDEVREARAAAAEQKKLREAAAIVLEQSLRDLGYAVEEIEETLFVEGGVAHFQRPEWGDYFVRLRIDPKRNAMNFNVVRAATSGRAGEDRRHEDMLAEDRWCSAFPRLFETLQARGIPIHVTRLLQAGEAPVQVVDAATLPARTTEERRHEALRARSLP